MKKTNLFLPLLMLVTLSFMPSCDSNDVHFSTPDEPIVRDYCYVTYTNTTSDYCAIIFIDGVSYKSTEGGDWTLFAGKSQKITMYNLKFPKDVRIDLHKIANENQYYKDVYKSFGEQGYTFKPEYDYKITIREDRCTINYVLAD